MSNRRLSWSAALRDLKADRARPEPVREERLRTSGAGYPLSAWRGRSGRRYVVGIHTLDTLPAFADLHAGKPVVALIVDRDTAGAAGRPVVGIVADAAQHARLIALARRDAAAEIHVCRLCADDAERDAMVADLRFEIAPDAALIAAAHTRGGALAADLCGGR